MSIEQLRELAEDLDKERREAWRQAYCAKDLAWEIAFRIQASRTCITLSEQDVLLQLVEDNMKMSCSCESCRGKELFIHDAVLLNCGHKMHNSCFEEWKKPYCPACRHPFAKRDLSRIHSSR
jgi:hypothetical protein